jgi:hypothetical protein
MQSMMAQMNLVELRRPMHLLRDQDPAVCIDGERAEVEDLVVQGAKGDSVGLDVGTAGLVPLDVRCLNPDHNAANPKIKAAHSAAVFVGGEDPGPEGRVPARASGGLGVVGGCGGRNHGSRSNVDWLEPMIFNRSGLRDSTTSQPRAIWYSQADSMHHLGLTGPCEK